LDKTEKRLDVILSSGRFQPLIKLVRQAETFSDAELVLTTS
jgi:hypothetical protein